MCIRDRLDAARNSPHLESFTRNGIEVLFFTDAVDEFWLERDLSYQDKKFLSITKGEIDLEQDTSESAPTAQNENDGDLAGLLQALRGLLQDEVKDVRVSGRLTDSPACLVGDKEAVSYTHLTLPTKRIV